MSTTPGLPLRYPTLADSHFIHRAGMRTLEPLHGVDAAVELDVTEENSNGAGGLQGGMLATLVDCVAGQAVARSVEPGAAYSTQDLTIHYIATLRTGPARALARVRRAGRRSVVLQVDVVDAGDADRLCAIATVTFAVSVASA